MPIVTVFVGVAAIRETRMDAVHFLTKIRYTRHADFLTNIKAVTNAPCCLIMTLLYWVLFTRCSSLVIFLHLIFFWPMDITVLHLRNVLARVFLRQSVIVVKLC